MTQFTTCTPCGRILSWKKHASIIDLRQNWRCTHKLSILHAYAWLCAVKSCACNNTELKYLLFLGTINRCILVTVIHDPSDRSFLQQNEAFLGLFSDLLYFNLLVVFCLLATRRLTRCFNVLSEMKEGKIPPPREKPLQFHLFPFPKKNFLSKHSRFPTSSRCYLHKK